MMIVKQQIPDRRFTEEEVANLESRVSEGDLASMTALTADAIRFCLDSPEVMEHRKELVLEGKNQSDRNVLRNAAILAAHLDDLYSLDSIIKYLATRGDMSTLAVVGNVLTKSEKEPSRSRGLEYIKLAADRGHLWSKSRYVRLGFLKWGPLAGLLWVFYLPYIFMLLALYSVKDPTDRRLRVD